MYIKICIKLYHNGLLHYDIIINMYMVIDIFLKILNCNAGLKNTSVTL